ncbi:QacE family quaternary ammonium compound efflux SMR transporter [Paenibacillus baekrokdamisoli]|uniref:QacE family quaternary ammonium compound efflux SMR transporter n=1 Tax=Paenibacillus baekrokdamisoli TaxID=1712516 RepID=A0A3G9J033_9BACL|nr:multidrug efflux SMR transporter [Paenibacillus baekrokdamisoli]MBB3071439.1 paired small multidrug resistance pump [Paenibacillus baekrokdamisoli]BBH24530.1 QacE family quaternary ammonium compound efflux SMR transporter [Paenibacillus baekrokdamisoli]
MGWAFLTLAGMFEVVGVIGMNKVSKHRNLQSFIILFGGMIMSFGFLSQAMKTLPMGTAYAIWTGIGTVGGTLVGIFFYGESNDWKRILFISMVLAAAIGLKLIS